MQGVHTDRLEEGAQAAGYGSVVDTVSFPVDVENLRYNNARVDGSHVNKRRRIVGSALVGLSACAIVLGIVRSTSSRGNTAALLGRKYASAGECITESCPTPLLAGLFEHPVDVAAAMRCAEGAKPGASAADICAEDLESLGSTGSDLASCGRCSGCLAGSADDAACQPASAVSLAAVTEEETAFETTGGADEGNQAAKLAAISDCMGLKCYGSAARVGLHDGKQAARSLWSCLKDSGSDADAASACFDSTPSISDSTSAHQLRECSECAGCFNVADATAQDKDMDTTDMAACDVPKQSFSAILKESGKTDADDDAAAAADDDDASHSLSTGDDKYKPIDDEAATPAGDADGDATTADYNVTSAPTLAPMEPEEPRVWDCLGLSCSKALADMAMMNPWDMIEIFKCMDAAGSNMTLGADCFDEVNSTVPAVVTFETCALCHGCIDGATPSVEVCEQTPSTYMPIGAAPGTNGWTMGSAGAGAAVFDYSKFMDYSKYMPGANGGIPMDYSKFMDYSQYVPAGIMAGGGGGTGASGAYFDWTAMAGGQQVGGAYGKPLPFRPAPAASASSAGGGNTGMTRLDAAAGDDTSATKPAGDDKAAAAAADSGETKETVAGQQPQQEKQPQQPEQPQQVPLRVFGGEQPQQIPGQVPFYGQQPQQIPIGAGYRGPPHGELPPSEWQKYATNWFPGQQAQQPPAQRPIQLDAETPADDAVAADDAADDAAATDSAGDVKEAQAPDDPEQASQPQQVPQPQQKQQKKQPQQPEQPEQPQQVFHMPGQQPQQIGQQAQQPQIGQQAEQPQLPPSVWQQYATGWIPGQQAQQPPLTQQRPMQLDESTHGDDAAVTDSAGDVKEAQAPEGPEQASQPQQVPQPQQKKQPQQPEQPEQPQQIFQMPQRGQLPQLPQPQQPQQPQIGQQAEQPQLPPSVWQQYATGWFPGQQAQQPPLQQQRPAQLNAETPDDAAAEDTKMEEAAEPLPGWSQWTNAGQGGQGGEQGQPSAAGGGYYDWSKWSQQQAPGGAAAGAPAGGNTGGYDWSQYAKGQGGQQYGGQPGGDAGANAGATQLVAEAPAGPQSQQAQQPQQGTYDWSKWASGQQVSGQYGMSPAAAAAAGQRGGMGSSGGAPQAGAAAGGNNANAGTYDWSKWAAGQQVSGQNGIPPAAGAAGPTQLAAEVPEGAQQGAAAPMGGYDWSQWAGGQQAGGQAAGQQPGAAAASAGGYDWSKYAGAMGQGGQAGAGGAADWSKWSAAGNAGGGQQWQPSAPAGAAGMAGSPAESGVAEAGTGLNYATGWQKMDPSQFAAPPGGGDGKGINLNDQRPGKVSSAEELKEPKELDVTEKNEKVVPGYYPRVWDCLGSLCNTHLSMMLATSGGKSAPLLHCLDGAAADTAAGAGCLDDATAGPDSSPPVMMLDACAQCNGCVDHSDATCGN